MSRGLGRTVLGASAATLVSRIMGFARNIMLAAALGTGLVADSYNLANQVPNQLFLLLGGGTIAAVFLPQLAKLSVRSASDADRYGTALLIGSAVFGVMTSLVMMVFAAPLIGTLSGGQLSYSQQELTVLLFLWCIPQVAAYALYAVASQLMNVRGKFTLVGWLPSVSSASIIIASAVIIANGVIPANEPESVSAKVITLLGASTLGGTLLQVLILLALLFRVGFRLRTKGGFRGLGMRAAVSTGALAVAAAATYQVSNLFVAGITVQSGNSAENLGFNGYGYSAYFYATALISVVQGIAVSSLASILLQRMAKHFATGDNKSAHNELNTATLRLMSFVIPVVGVFVACGPLLTELMFARGSTTQEAARIIGVTLAVLSVGLIPFTWHTLLIRPFYAKHDAIRPLMSGINLSIIWIGGSLFSSMMLPPQFVILGVAASFSLAYWIDLPIKMIWLRRRLGYRLDLTNLKEIVFASSVMAVVTILLGFPAWFMLFDMQLSQLAIAGICFLQICCILVIYTYLLRRREISLVFLVRWLKK